MVLNRISVSAKRKIVGVTLGILSLATMPSVGPAISGLLDKSAVGPITFGIIAGALGLVGTYMMLFREGI